MTNAMTELEKQLCQKLLELQAENLVVWMQLQRCQTEYNEQSATIQELRAELAEAKRNWQAADNCLDKTGSIITAAIGCSGSGVLYDCELLVKELAKAKAEIEDSQKLATSYKDAFCRALTCVDKVFQDGGKEPCILPDYLRLGADKFEAVVTLANDYLSMKERAERAERELNTRVNAINSELIQSLTAERNELVTTNNRLTKERDALAEIEARNNKREEL